MVHKEAVWAPPMEATLHMSVGVLPWKLDRSSGFWLECSQIHAQIPLGPHCAVAEEVGALSSFVVMASHCWQLVEVVAPAKYIQREDYLRRSTWVA